MLCISLPVPLSNRRMDGNYRSMEGKYRCMEGKYRRMEGKSRKLFMRSLLIIGVICALTLKIIYATSNPFRIQSDTTNISLVIPATREDFVCFANHVARNLAQLSVLPNECIFIVSGWQGDASDVDFTQLETLTSVQVVTFPHEQNQARNRNIGASIAHGEYVFFFDIDDVLYRDAFKLVSNSIKSFDKPEGVIFAHGPRRSMKFGTSLPAQPFCVNSYAPCEKRKVHTSQEMFHALFEHWIDASALSSAHWCCLQQRMRYHIAPGWLLVRRASFLSHGIYDDNIWTGEDGNQIARMISQHLQVLYFNVPVGYYNRDHQHPACASGIKSTKLFPSKQG